MPRPQQKGGTPERIPPSPQYCVVAYRLRQPVLVAQEAGQSRDGEAPALVRLQTVVEQQQHTGKPGDGRHTENHQPNQHPHQRDYP